MGQGTVRWIAIALVGALVAALAVSLVSGAGPDAASTTEDRDGSTAPGSRATAVLEGPHLWLDLCAGVECPTLDEGGQEALVDELEADPRVASTLFVTGEQAYQLFLDRFGDQQDLVESVRPEDVPARIEVDLLDPADVDAVMGDYADREGVARANDARRVQP